MPPEQKTTTYMLSPTRKRFWWITVKRDSDGRPILRSVRLHSRKRRGGWANSV